MSRNLTKLYNRFHMDFTELEDQPSSSQSLDEDEEEHYKELARVVVQLVEVTLISIDLFFRLSLADHLLDVRTSSNLLVVVEKEVTVVVVMKRVLIVHLQRMSKSVSVVFEGHETHPLVSLSYYRDNRDTQMLIQFKQNIVINLGG